MINVFTCWENADLWDLVCVMFSCVFVTLPYGILGQVWYLIVWIPYLCYFFLTCVYRLSVLCLGQNRIIAVRFQYRLSHGVAHIIIMGDFPEYRLAQNILCFNSLHQICKRQRVVNLDLKFN